MVFPRQIVLIEESEAIRDNADMKSLVISFLSLCRCQWVMDRSAFQLGTLDVSTIWNVSMALFFAIILYRPNSHATVLLSELFGAHAELVVHSSGNVGVPLFMSILFLLGSSSGF